ncbi:MAG: metallophosphoesterase [Acidobacteria bacterium]|nr:metallophosphoesterase [Acidobacteriota bacterium]
MTKLPVHRRLLIVVALAFAILSNGLPASAEDTFEGVDRVVAMGDLHGDFDAFVQLLRSARLIDRRNNWTGGKAYLVQMGDILDRGADSRKIMDLLMKLEEQSEKAGGRVHVLLGNHEVMNILGDLRYVSAGEYESYKSPRAAEMRDQVFEAQATEEQKKDGAYRRKWEQDHPLGWVEHRLAFGVTGAYGKWLRQKNCVIRIDQVLFSHGGISPKYASMPIREMNELVRADLTKDISALVDTITRDAEGPLWYRGLAQAPEAELAAHVDSLLSTYGVQHVVVAHTPTPGVVLPRFGSKVILIDVGISEYYGKTAACLVFEGSKPYALHRGHRLELPVGQDIMAYLKRAVSYDPPNSLLHKWLDRMARREAGSEQ